MPNGKQLIIFAFFLSCPFFVNGQRTSGEFKTTEFGVKYDAAYDKWLEMLAMPEKVDEHMDVYLKTLLHFQSSKFHVISREMIDKYHESYQTSMLYLEWNMTNIHLDVKTNLCKYCL